MFGDVVERDSHHISVNSADSSSYKGIYYGNFHFDKHGDVSGTVTGFSYIFGSSSYTFVEFSDLHANAAKVFKLVDDGNVQPLLKYLLRGDDQFDTTDFQILYGGNTVNGYGGNDTIRLCGGDTAFGGTGDDLLIGNGQTERLNGGKGEDTLFGAAGSDRLSGGAGSDTFLFRRVSDSTQAAHDTIVDFSRKEHDIIDLSGIDANGRVAGHKHFAFIGEQAFHGVRGELRFETNGQTTFVQGDVDGDGKAEFVMALHGDIDLHKSDFHL
jgi:Ca2+-binding RTX toxin-like protein